MTKSFKTLLIHAFVIGVIVFGISNSVNAQTGDDRWVLIERNFSEEYYYDSLTVSQTGDTTIIWVKTIYIKKIEDEDGEVLKSSVNKLILFCGKTKYTMTDIEVTYRDGSSKEIDYQEKNRYVRPETVIDKLYTRFCR